MAAPLHVVVVGGGIIGASIAWHLAALHHAKVKVTVVAADVGGVATPNSFAWINANRGNPRFYYDLRRRSIARWRTLAAADGDQSVPGLNRLVSWAGSVQWDQSPDELAAFVDQHQGWGYNVARVENAAIAAAEPRLAEEALPSWGWGVQAAEEGAVEPAAAAQLLLDHAHKTFGLRLVTDTLVERVLLAEDGTVNGVLTKSGTTLDADHVVLAAGLGTVALCASAGITLPVTGRPGLLAHSKPVSERLLNGIVLSSGPHVRQTAEGRVVVGGNFAGSDPGLTADAAQAASETLLVQARRLFRPDDAQRLELDYYTVGVRPQPQDGFPILGRVGGRPGLTLAVMHSGVTLAAIVGELLAAQVATGQTDAALEAFALSRFDSQTTA